MSLLLKKKVELSGVEIMLCPHSACVQKKRNLDVLKGPGNTTKNSDKNGRGKDRYHVIP